MVLATLLVSATVLGAARLPPPELPATTTCKSDRPAIATADRHARTTVGATLYDAVVAAFDNAVDSTDDETFDNAVDSTDDETIDNAVDSTDDETIDKAVDSTNDKAVNKAADKAN